MVALDLGGSGLRAVQFTQGKSTPAVGKVAFAPLPDNVIAGGEVKDVEAVSAALKDMWAREKFSTKDVVFGLANANVLVRMMDLDWMPEAEFRTSLRYQVEDKITMDLDTANLDYHPLSEVEIPQEDGSTRRITRILLVAAAKTAVDPFVAAIQGAGLQPVKADLVPFALIRSAQSDQPHSDSVEVVLDMGADVTNVIIHQNGQPRFVRMVTNQGGRSLTNTLMETFGWSQEDAERSKIKLGLGSAAAPVAAVGETVFGGAAAAPQAQEQQHPAQQIINHVVSAFIGEIRTSVDFFLSQSADISNISRVVLTGGGGNLVGLPARLSSELRVPVEYGTPMQKVARGKHAALPEGLTDQQMSVAVGLALGAA